MKSQFEEQEATFFEQAQRHVAFVHRLEHDIDDIGKARNEGFVRGRNRPDRSARESSLPQKASGWGMIGDG